MDTIDKKCLDDRLLSSYLDKRLSGPERGKIEGHIADCGACLDKLLVAHESRGRVRKVPLMLRNKIKSRLGLKQTKKRPEIKWLAASMGFFVFSFLVRHYFLQFLAISVILGFKWVMEGEGAKRVIMIFKEIREKEKKFERKPPPDVSNIIGGDKYGKPE
ncbi:MAG: anti-sigma factor [Candidatus Omnitrophota bacterium]|jgi:hypothetical protein